MTYSEAKAKLEKYGQEQLLRYYDELSDSEKQALLDQIDSADMSVVSYYDKRGEVAPAGHIEPLAAMELDEIRKRSDEFRRIGLDAIRAGKVGAVLLAGGMGTRLGSDNPKGMYNIGITKEVYIFQRIIENLLDVVNEAESWIHLFIMTSEKNNEATVNFLREKKFFGYNEEYVTFFTQEMAPAVDYNGKIFLETKSRMATSPNGNGGWFSSMLRCDVVKI